MIRLLYLNIFLENIMRPLNTFLALASATQLAEASYYAGCTDFDWDGETDITGDGCSSYDQYPDWCGEYDDDDFWSNAYCCACGGGYWADDWINLNAKNVKVEDSDYATGAIAFCSAIATLAVFGYTTHQALNKRVAVTQDQDTFLKL